MFPTVEGVFRDGKIELTEAPAGITESKVMVTFLDARRAVDLRELGIGEKEAAEMRWRMQASEEDWNHPGMDVYDDM